MRVRRCSTVVRWAAVTGMATLGCVGAPPSPPAAGSGSTGPAPTSTGSTRGSDASTSTVAQDTGAGASTTQAGTETTDDSTSESSCIDHAQCPGAVCLEGTCTTVGSCLQLADLDPGDTLPSGVYPLDPDGEGGVAAYDAYCELELMGGGWTLVLKALGENTTFEWDSPLWLDEDPFQPDFPDLDRNEAKLASYAHVPFTELLVGMEHPIGTDDDDLKMAWLAVPVEGESLHALISPGEYVPTAVGREAWKGLIEGSSLQVNCNREGINADSDFPTYAGVRIGIIANEQDDCGTPDSRLGVGGRLSDQGLPCNTQPIPHGNIAGCSPDNGVVNLPAFAAVLVR